MQRDNRTPKKGYLPLFLEQRKPSQELAFEWGFGELASDEIGTQGGGWSGTFLQRNEYLL